MRPIRALILVFIMSTLYGCVASGAIYEKNAASTGPKITIFRQNGFVGKANCYKVLLNNGLVGKLQSGGYLTAETKKGKNIITIPFEKDPLSIVFNVNNNDEYYVEYSISSEGSSHIGRMTTNYFGMRLTLVEDAYAIEKLQTLKESKSFCIAL